VHMVVKRLSMESDWSVDKYEVVVKK
jgi:hypothetical protein